MQWESMWIGKLLGQCGLQVLSMVQPWSVNSKGGQGEIAMQSLTSWLMWEAPTLILPEKMLHVWRLETNAFNNVALICRALGIMLQCVAYKSSSSNIPLIILKYEPDLSIANSWRCLFIPIVSVSPEAKWLGRLVDSTYLCAHMWGKMKTHMPNHHHAISCHADPRMLPFERLKRPYTMLPRTYCMYTPTRHS